MFEHVDVELRSGDFGMYCSFNIHFFSTPMSASLTLSVSSLFLILVVCLANALFECHACPMLPRISVLPLAPLSTPLLLACKFICLFCLFFCSFLVLSAPRPKSESAALPLPSCRHPGTSSMCVSLASGSTPSATLSSGC